MEQLCNRRINYYFAAITKFTNQMARVMQDCYAHSHNAEFKVWPPGSCALLACRHMRSGIGALPVGRFIRGC